MKDILPGDKITINLNSLIESLPMIAPALDGWKANFDFYFEPWSNLYGFMDNNVREGTQDLINKRRHTFKFGLDKESPVLVETIEAMRVKPGSLLDYYGLPCGYFGDVDNEGAVHSSEYPAEKILAYLDIIRTYYVNNQEGFVPFMWNMDSRSVLDDDFGVERFSLQTLDDLFMILRMQKDGVVVNDDPFDSIDLYDVPEVNRLLRVVTDTADDLCGLALRTYRMDLNRGIMNANVGNLKSRVQVTDNSFSIDTLRFANKMQKLIDRFDVSGGRFSDWMRTQWNVKVRGNLDVPDYLGTVSEFFGNTDVIATANGAVSTTPGVQDTAKQSILGEQAGFAVGRVNRSNSPISFKSDQYGTLVCLFSLVPIVDYSQGIEIENLKTTFADVYTPAMSQLGFQDVNRKELSAFPTALVAEDGDTTSFKLFDRNITFNAPAVGKRVAWSEYMASLGRNHGYFSYGEQLDFWANQRMYTTEIDSGDPGDVMVRYGEFNPTTYVYPYLWNYLFADTSPRTQNFRLRCRFDITAKRPIGSRIMPHL